MHADSVVGPFALLPCFVLPTHSSTALHAVLIPAQRNGVTLDDKKLIESRHFHGSTCRCNHSKNGDNHPNGTGNQTDCGCQGTGFVDVNMKELVLLLKKICGLSKFVPIHQ